MQLTANAQVLSAEVRRLVPIASAKTTLPVLSNILIRAEEELMLATTDLQVAMTTSCKVAIAFPGTITIPAKKLLEILDQLGNADVTIEVKKGQAHISSGLFKSRLQTLSAEDFPPIPTVETETTPLPADRLRMMIERTAYAISDKTAMYVLKGALLSLHEGVFAMIATDGKRLSVATGNKDTGPSVQAIVPQKALEALVPHCDSGKVVEFSTNGKHLQFKVGHRVLVSQMLEGTFPNYQRIIPTDCDKEILVDRVALMAALKRVGVVADDLCGVYFGFVSGGVYLTSSSAEIGDAAEMVPTSYEGPDLRVLVNGSYMLDFLDKAVQPKVSVKASTSERPLLLTDGPDFVNVVLGMRV